MKLKTGRTPGFTLSTGRIRFAVRRVSPLCAGSFTTALTGRYMLRPRFERILQMVFWRTPAPQMNQSVHWHRAIHIFPQILLRFAPAPSLTLPQTLPDRPGDSPKERMQLTLRETRMVETLSERVFTHQVQRESDDARILHSIAPSIAFARRETRQPLTQSEPPPSSASVRLVFRRAAPPSESSRSATDLPGQLHTTGNPALPWHNADTSAAAKPASLSPVELQRLTDHVVGAIDRRAVAHRERRGLA